MEKILKQAAELYAAFAKDANAQVEKGNKAAGTRARKAALEICKLMKDFIEQGGVSTDLIYWKKTDGIGTIEPVVEVNYNILNKNYDEALRWFKEAQSKGNRTVKSYIWYLEKKFCKEE